MEERGLKVLVVDDEARLRDTMVRTLCIRGMDARGAGGGSEALRMLESFPAEVVILDLAMPGWPGAETLQRMRADGCLAEVVVLTGHASVDTALDLLDRGASDYLLKPCPVSELAAVIRRLAHRRAVARGLPGQDAGDGPPK